MYLHQYDYIFAIGTCLRSSMSITKVLGTIFEFLGARTADTIENKRRHPCFCLKDNAGVQMMAFT